MVILQPSRYLASAALLLVPLATASAQPLPAPASGGSLPAASAVATVYDTFNMAPLWFRGGAVSPAANQLVQILRRAPFDGFALGPQLAVQAESAILQAQSGNPQAIASAERSLSTAWVAYVQALKKPTQGMIYAYPVLQPQGVRADQILLTAAAAPSLEVHLSSVSNLNPVYAQLRAAAIAEAQASGSMVPDPRLIANLDRARSIPAGGKFALVDAATQQLWMYENGVVVDSMKVIVGTSETPTPMIASIIHYATFNPYWNVPDNLIRKTVAPNAVRQGAAYLKPRGYEVMADWTENAAVIPSSQIDWKAVTAGQKQIRVRQQPGPGNSMGKFKYSFPNGEDIFLHDTPSKELFARSNRALSNGCVRLEDAQRFGRWLLGREPVAPGADPEIHVQLPQGVPVFLTYLTAHPDGGRITYTTDVYGWDHQAQVAGR